MSSSGDKVSEDVEKGTDVPTKEEQPNASNSSTTSSFPRKLLWLLGGLLLLAGIVVAITVPLVRDDSSDDSSDDPGEGPSSSPNPEGGGNDLGNVIALQGLLYNVTLPTFGQGVTQGYQTKEAFQQDLTLVVQSLMNGVVARNTGVRGFENVARGGPMMIFDDVMVDGVPVAGVPEAADATANKSPVGDTVNDFETNNQEDGVEEGDVVVATENIVYAVFGDYLLAWSTDDGEILAELQMDPIPKPDNTGTTPLEDPILPIDEPILGTSDIFYPYYQPKPIIHSLLLHGTRLLVVTGGYSYPSFFLDAETVPPILTEYGDTRVLVYETASLGQPDGKLELITSETINGRFASVRSVEGNIHLVTTSGLNMYNALIAPFEKSNSKEFSNLSNDAYIAEVKRVADEEVIPQFVDQLTKELLVQGNLPDFFQLNAWEKDSSSPASDSGRLMSPFLYPEGYANTVATVVSFDISTASTESGLTLSATGAVLASYGAEVYSAPNMMILASTGTSYDEDRGAAIQTTYLMSVELNGASSSPHSVGSCDGYFLNQFSFDVSHGVLFVATSIRNMWWWGPPIALEDETLTSVLEEESTTENYIITMTLPGLDGTEAGTMQEISRLRLGKPEELFTSVRFFDNITYAVTFQRRDPFYMLDTSDPENIAILAEVNITGFSTYLHSMNDENTLILAIGEEANDEGIVLGMQLSVFDFGDPDNVQVFRYLIETDPDTYSWSAASWDKNAVRYNRDTGRLIIPMNLNSWTNETLNFNGFKVFLVTPTSIEEDTDCAVQIGPNPGDFEIQVCRYCAYIGPRAMIFDGSYMAMMDHSVVRTDLDTCIKDWEFDIMIPPPDGSCC